MEKYAALWEPIDLGPVTIKNRVAVTAHALQYSGLDNVMTQQSVDYYEERAKGGAGLILTEAQAVHVSSRGLAPRTLQGWPTETIPVYERLATAVHRHGAKVFIDLSHFGVEDNGTMFLDNWRPLWGPSGLPSTTYGEIGHAMTVEDIQTVVDGFGRSARNAYVAGLDGAEIHAAHGYLLCSFLSPLSNKRDDEYGGSVENRTRIVQECARAVRAATGDGFAVGVRLSLDEGVPGGIDVEHGQEIARILADTGLFDYFSISAGNAATFDRVVAPMSMPGARNVELAIAAKKVVGDHPVITANGIADLSTAAGIITDGSADMVAMTRAHIADPLLIQKARDGREDEIRHCISANQGCIHRMAQGWSLTCTQNPAAGREKILGSGTLVPATEPRHIVVVGGGPAGMRAAEVAASRGHRVTLLERSDRLGGQIRIAAELPTRGRWNVLVKDSERRLQRFGADVRLGTDATVDLVRALEPDEVVLATGSTWRKDGFAVMLGFRPGIPGLETTAVLDPIEAITAPERTGDRVLIVDDTGEYTALGLAEMLAGQGKTVEVVTTRLFAGDNIVLNLDLGHVYPRLYAAGVTITPQHFVAEINAEGATIASVWGGPSRTVAVDSVVTVMLRDPEQSLLAPLSEFFRVRQIGDSLAPRRVDEAIYEGEIAGREAGQPELVTS
jgi:2,4-dienoyl-CoA reductase-like NADH-dependent reductase (Old Yellow Enzyme family)/thioredoxin reductase